jgi:DNA ligase-1
VLFAELAATSAQVAATSARSQKVALIAAALREADAADVRPAVAYLSGELLQRRPGVGWAAMRGPREPGEAGQAATEATLTVGEVDATFEELAGLSGEGSVRRRRELLDGLLTRATADEQRFLRGLVTGELRQGALVSLVVDAVARAADVPLEGVRRAVMLAGGPGPVAEAVLVEGAGGLDRFHLVVGRPVQPMLAQTATTVADALDRVGGTAAVEWKLDGVRVQIHRDGDQVRVFTRTLDDITTRVPEVVAAARAVAADQVLLDGEAIALDAEGRPRPFQVTGSRVGSRVDVERAVRETPLSTYLFDVLHVDGTDVLDRPGSDRHEVLARVVPESLRVPRLVTDDPAAAQAFLDEALARGHEGVVVKAVDQPYAAGRRGAGWVKVKPVHTLDLVVLAVEWGHGRRRGWLSNLHLGARDPATGGFVMLGKTFKGLTDEMLRWQSERLLALEESRNEWQVFVRPELVVEVAFDGVQTSPRYEGGMALRFARVVRYRDDKAAADADTVDTVRAIHTR